MGEVFFHNIYDVEFFSKILIIENSFRKYNCFDTLPKLENQEMIVTKVRRLLGKGGPGAYAQNAAGTRYNAAIASGVPGAFSEHSFGRPKECCPPRPVVRSLSEGGRVASGET
jgi:hypothetical protein